MSNAVEKRKKLTRIKNQIDKSFESKPTNLDKLFGLLKGSIKEDPVKLQRTWRDGDR